jgi:hypothetical protein
MTDLTPAEREALERLRDVIPPAHAGARVRDALRAEGLLRDAAGGARWLPRVAAALIAVALFVSGFYAGKGAAPMQNESPPPPSGRQYMLLVIESPAVFENGRTTEQLVSEYGAWARELGARGALVDGWKLTDDGRTLDPSSGRVRTTEFAVTPGQVGGLFIIRAADYDEAVRIAESSPHVRYGGIMEVRAIDG